VTSLLLIVAAFTEGGIATLGVREFSSGGNSERDELMGSLLGMRLALSLAGAGGAILFTALAGYPGVVVAGTAIASIGLLLANLQVTLAIPLTAALRLQWLAVLDSRARPSPPPDSSCSSSSVPRCCRSSQPPSFHLS